jgi:hypothetical protein
MKNGVRSSGDSKRSLQHMPAVQYGFKQVIFAMLAIASSRGEGHNHQKTK